MDDGAGAAIGTFVVVGVGYLAAEFLALVLVAAAVGAVVGAVIVLVCAATAARWVIRNPRPPGARAWALFAGGSSTMLAAPFGVMWLAAGGTTQVGSEGMPPAATVLGPVCFLALAGALIYGIPTLYQHCSALSMAQWPLRPARPEPPRAFVHSPASGRVGAVQRLAATGRLDQSYADRITVGGSVSDADWLMLCQQHPDGAQLDVEVR